MLDLKPSTYRGSVKNKEARIWEERADVPTMAATVIGSWTGAVYEVYSREDDRSTRWDEPAQPFTFWTWRDESKRGPSTSYASNQHVTPEAAAAAVQVHDKHKAAMGEPLAREEYAAACARFSAEVFPDAEIRRLAMHLERSPWMTGEDQDKNLAWRLAHRRMLAHASELGLDREPAQAPWDTIGGRLVNAKISDAPAVAAAEGLEPTMAGRDAPLAAPVAPAAAAPRRWGAHGTRYDEDCARCGRESEVDNDTDLCQRCGGGDA